MMFFHIVCKLINVFITINNRKQIEKRLNHASAPAIVTKLLSVDIDGVHKNYTSSEIVGKKYGKFTLVTNKHLRKSGKKEIIL